MLHSNMRLIGLNESYIRALVTLGAAPIIIPLDGHTSTLRSIFSRIDGLFLAGGCDVAPSNYGQSRSRFVNEVDEERDFVELMFASWALENNTPVFGVCRGMQVLNIACGGTLLQNISAFHLNSIKHDYFPPTSPKNYLSHTVDIKAGSYLASVLGSRTMINSCHHQAIDIVGSDIKIVAKAPDGIPEAIEIATNRFSVGVQWHPEALVDSTREQAQLFRDFVTACQPSVFSSIH